MESLKTVLNFIVPSGAVKGVKFDINLGNNEVIILEALYYSHNMVPAVGMNATSLGLYRKSEKLPVTIFSNNDSDLIWSNKDVGKFVVETMKVSWSEMIYFPLGFTLIRPPQLLGQFTGGASDGIMMRLYYRIKKISDAEMAKLMLKDHD